MCYLLITCSSRIQPHSDRLVRYLLISCSGRIQPHSVIQVCYLLITCSSRIQPHRDRQVCYFLITCSSRIQPHSDRLVCYLLITCSRQIQPQQLTELLGVYGFAVCQTEATRVPGGIIDVVVTRCDLTPPDFTVYDAGLSDHHLLQWSVPMTKPSPPVVSVVRRPWHLLNVDALRAGLSASRLCQPDSWIDCSIDQLAELYTS